MLVPVTGATLSGTTTLDASASNATSVEFWLLGGSYGYTGHMIGTATPTPYGWVVTSWNTTTVPSTSYALLSEAFNARGSAFSAPVSITVNNSPPPTTSVLVPVTGATLSGTTTLDASASNATSVEFWLLGGSYGYTGHMIGTATPTPYGWVSTWNTTTVPNASYALLSEAFGAGGSAFSSPISIIVTNTSWPQNSYGPDRNGYQPNETTIGTANVGTLALVRTYKAASGGASSPLIANGILYEVIAGTLYAFDATGSTNCSGAPTTCTPLWTAPAAYFYGMTIANGDVFVSDGEGVQAYDAVGSTSCSGTPKVCKPLWQTSTNTGSGPGFSSGSGSPVVTNGVLYVPGYGDGLAPNLGGALVAAFDTAGSKGCTVYSGFGDTCVPMWTTSGIPASEGNTGSPAIANGVIYIANGTLYAFDGAGSTNCTGTPKVCSPLWTGTTSSSPTYSAPSVANGTVYVASWDSKLYAFAAAGSTNCSVTVVRRPAHHFGPQRPRTASTALQQ